MATRNPFLTPKAVSMFGALLSALALTPSVSASPLMFTATPTVAIAAVGLLCNDNPLLGAPSTPTNAVGPSAAKSTAILGGELSALDRIRMAQSNSPIPAQPAGQGLAPMGTAALASGCPSGLSKIVGLPLRLPVATRPASEFLASKRIPIGRTSFDRNWDNVRNEDLSKTFRRQFGARSLPSLDIIIRVNHWVNSRIEYVDDRDLFNRADYWAGARHTLRLGKGDCEDIALTKMQLLAAAGFSREDMYLTITRDRVRAADHAVLVVRLGDRFVVLDNATDEVLDGANDYDYTPLLSFSAGATWLHGY